MHTWSSRLAHQEANALSSRSYRWGWSPSKNEDVTDRRLCELWCTVLEARIGGDRHHCHETFLRYVQKAHDDIRWETDRRISWTLGHKKESASGSGIPYSFWRLAGGTGSQFFSVHVNTWSRVAQFRRFVARAELSSFPNLPISLAMAVSWDRRRHHAHWRCSTSITSFSPRRLAEAFNGTDVLYISLSEMHLGPANNDREHLRNWNDCSGSRSVFSIRNRYSVDGFWCFISQQPSFLNLPCAREGRETWVHLSALADEFTHVDFEGKKRGHSGSEVQARLSCGWFFVDHCFEPFLFAPGRDQPKESVRPFSTLFRALKLTILQWLLVDDWWPFLFPKLQDSTWITANTVGCDMAVKVASLHQIWWQLNMKEFHVMEEANMSSLAPWSDLRATLLNTAEEIYTENQYITNPLRVLWRSGVTVRNSICLYLFFLDPYPHLTKQPSRKRLMPYMLCGRPVHCQFHQLVLWWLCARPWTRFAWDSFNPSTRAFLPTAWQTFKQLVSRIMLPFCSELRLEGEMSEIHGPQQDGGTRYCT